MVIAEGEEIVVARALVDIKQGEWGEVALGGDYILEEPGSDYIFVMSRGVVWGVLPLTVVMLLWFGFLLGLWWAWS